jgi:hypothetical protein
MSARTGSVESPFARALRELAGKKKRIDLDTMWRALARAEPELLASADARSALATNLDALAEAGALQLPRLRRGWDASASPELPFFVTLVSAPKVRAEPKLEVAWAPELAFGAEITLRAHREILERVQRFLAHGGRERPLVPERERSLELIDDEKALESYRKGALFAEGRLTLALLRCFSVSPPLVREPCEGGLPRALIIENHHTFHSFAQWNAQAKQYRAIVYGAGKAAIKGAPSLASLANELSLEAIEYFGDLDAAGVRIGRQVSDECARAGAPRCQASARWYEALSAAAGDRRFPCHDERSRLSAADLAWLPESVRELARRLDARRQRFPQELVGWERLRVETCDLGALP